MSPNGGKKTRGVTGIAALVMLAGCQLPTTLKSILEDGTRTTHILREEPHRAAVCIARNIDRHGNGYTAQIRPGVAPALIEVHVRAEQAVSLTRLLVKSEGSLAEIWMTPDSRHRRDELAGVMIAGC